MPEETQAIVEAEFEDEPEAAEGALAAQAGRPCAQGSGGGPGPRPRCGREASPMLTWSACVDVPQIVGFDVAGKLHRPVEQDLPDPSSPVPPLGVGIFIPPSRNLCDHNHH